MRSELVNGITPGAFPGGGFVIGAREAEYRRNRKRIGALL
jgi:hypothetical protein